MKKRILSIFIALLLLGGTAYAATYVCSDLDYSVVVNGQTMSFTDALPMQYNGRTMLPLRAMCDALGINITWNEAKRQAEVQTIDTEALKASCVMVYSGNNPNLTAKQGSGVLIDYDKVLTCYHITNTYTYFWDIYNSGTTYYPCSIAKSNSAEDVAILTPQDKTKKPVKIGDSEEIKEGDKVYIISCPQGQKNVVTSGMVRRINIQDTTGLKLFETTASIQGGSSGGACFNVKGELIGIVDGVTSTYSNIIPINDIRQALAS